MTSQSCTGVCCKDVAAGEVSERGLGICNLLWSGRWLLNSARCRAWKSSFLTSRTCLGLSNRYSLQRRRWKMSAQIGKFRALFCSVTGKFLEVFGGTVIDRSSLVWVRAFPCPLLGAGLWRRLLSGCDTSSYQPAPKLSLLSISCHAVRTRLLSVYIWLLHFHAND